MIDRKVIEKVNGLLRKQMVQKFGVFALAMAVIGSVAYFGTQRNQDSFAASVGILSMSTSVGVNAAVVGSNVTVTVTADSGTDPVNSVQAAITYDSTKLQYVSLAEGTAFPNIAATSTSTPGVVRVARSTTTGTAPVTGVNNIVTITFKVLGSSGTTALNFDQPFSFIVNADTNVNILTSVNTASIAMKLPAPSISSVSPASGPTAGGTALTITGANFVSGATVSVGGTAATSVVFGSATSLNVTAPARATAGAVSIVVTNPDGQTATLSNGYTYIAPAPTVTTITPSSGLVTGGTNITITGTNFVTGATVTVGGTAATSVVFTSSTSLTAVTPARTAGAADVVVRNPDSQTGTKAGGFTYINLAPTITTLSPTSGLTTGGTRVTINGTNFISGATVRFDTLAGTSVTFVSSSQVQATAPAHAAGAVNVVVTNPDNQTATKSLGFTYVNPAPTLTSITPASGLITGGTAATIQGTNFISGATVRIGGVAATAVTFTSSTTFTITTPVGTPGSKVVTVTNPDGQVTSQTGVTFRYLSNPGDANNDGRVNAIDLSTIITFDGQNYPAADFNGDGTIGAADMAILIPNWTW